MTAKEASFLQKAPAHRVNEVEDSEAARLTVPSEKAPARVRATVSVVGPRKNAW